MADVITRFKLETTQYDSKLRDASKGLAEYARTASLAGNEFDKFTKNNVAAAKAFGSIETSATNAKDKVKELVGAYNDMARAYNALTKEQQQSDWGKAMAESLTNLKGRIGEAKQELYSMGDTGKGTGSIIEQLTGKLGISTKSLGVWGAAISAGKVALDVAKDAFNANEAAMDEWGRTMQSCQGLYEGFLNAINNGDISGYLDRMDEIMKAARAAYDELDKLGTMKTIQAPAISAQQTENERIRMMIQTGRYIAPIDGRKPSPGLTNGQILTPEQIRRLEQQLQSGMQRVVGLVGNEVTQTGRAIDAYYNNLARQNGMNVSEFRQGTKSWEAFSEKMAGYEAYKKWDAQACTEFARQGGRGYVNFDKDNPYAEFKKWGTFRVDKMGENSFNELVNLIRQRDQQASQVYSTLSQSYRTINRAEGVTVRGLMGGSGGRSGTTVKTEEQEIAEQIKKLSAEYEKADAERREQLTNEIRLLQQRNAEIKYYQDLAVGNKVRPMGADVMEGQGIGLETVNSISKELSKPLDASAIKTPLQVMEEELQRLIDLQTQFGGVSAEAWGIYQDQIDDAQKKIDKFKGKDVGEKNKKAWEGAAQAVQSVGSAFSSIEDPSAQAAGTVMQAIASIALGFATASSQANTAGTGWGWLAWLAAGAAAMATTISTIHSLTGYAQGGIIKGNSYSGDNIGGLVDGSQLVGLDAGEVVLNASQQRMVAQNLQDNGGGMHVVGEIQGEKIVLVANRFLRRSGQGELVTWK